MDLKLKTDLKPLTSTLPDRKFRIDEEQDLKLHTVKNESSQDDLKPCKVENDTSATVTPAKCELCKYTGKDTERLDLHIHIAHTEDGNFKCNRPGCNFKTVNIKSLTNHVKLHEKLQLEKQFPFHCAFLGCDFRRREETQVKFHEQLHKTSGVQLECKLCPNKYPDIVSLSFHESLQHDQNPYKCELCDCILLSDFGLDQHIKKCHTSSATVENSHAATTNCRPEPEMRLPLDIRFLSSGTGAKNVEHAFICAICNFECLNEYSALKHSVVHRSPVIRLARINVHLV